MYESSPLFVSETFMVTSLVWPSTDSVLEADRKEKGDVISKGCYLIK